MNTAGYNALLPNEVVTALKTQQASLAVAESCSGGLICALLTQVPGASDVLYGGVVAYSEAAKVQLAQVPHRLLKQFGMVSTQVAEKMAQGIRAATSVTWGLSVTGLAGPSGGTAELPVGTVFVGIASESDTHVKRFLFHGNREQVRRHTAFTALTLLHKSITACAT